MGIYAKSGKYMDVYRAEFFSGHWRWRWLTIRKRQSTYCLKAKVVHGVYSAAFVTVEHLAQFPQTDEVKALSMRILMGIGQ